MAAPGRTLSHVAGGPAAGPVADPVADLPARLTAGSVTVVDVRGANEWASGHLPGALHALARRAGVEALRDRMFAELPQEWRDAYDAGIFTEFMEQRAPGHTVLEAATAADALALLNTRHVNVVVSDVRMPGDHDGVSLGKPGTKGRTDGTDLGSKGENPYVQEHIDMIASIRKGAPLNEGKQVCYVGGGLKPERREVETGEFTDEFIEIKKGLKEGEKVLLRPPDGTEQDNGREIKPAGEKPAAQPAEKSAPTPKPGKTAAAPRLLSKGSKMI